MQLPMICLSLVLSVSSHAFSSNAFQEPLHGWKAKNLTNAIVLAAVQESDTTVTFSFKNVSGRVISGFAVCFDCDHSGPDKNRTQAALGRDWFGSEPNGWMNAEIEKITQPTSNSRMQQRSLEISAVVFDDGTSEGWQPNIDSILFSRLGRILETERIKNILAAMKSRFSGDSDLKILSEKIGSLPESVDFALNELTTEAAALSMSNLQPRGTVARGALLSGVRTARQEMLWELAKLRNLPPTSTDSSVLTQAGLVSNLQQQYDEKAIRNRAYLKRTREIKKE